ncbi:hypothetical protein ACJJTC_014174 [Scirpophaga incertulas]
MKNEKADSRSLWIPYQRCLPLTNLLRTKPVLLRYSHCWVVLPKALRIAAVTTWTTTDTCSSQTRASANSCTFCSTIDGLAAQHSLALRIVIKPQRRRQDGFPPKHITRLASLDLPPRSSEATSINPHKRYINPITRDHLKKEDELRLGKTPTKRKNKEINSSETK